MGCSLENRATLKACALLLKMKQTDNMEVLEIHKMERLEAFEKMLKDIVEKTESEKEKMNEMKAQGKEKTATYKQYAANRLMYSRILMIYKEYGLI